MKDFFLHIPTKIFFGASKGQEFISEVSALGSNGSGSKALIVTGGGSVKRLGYLKQVCDLLTEKGVGFHIFSGIEPNPIATTINAAAAEGVKHQVNLVIAVGGGSAMDAAKAISCLIHQEESDIWPFVSGEPRAGQLSGALPLACVPTTAATASEVTPYSVISNPKVNGKSVLAHEFIKPLASWINPEFTTELPQVTTQDGAADILSHVFENYLLGGEDSILADRYSEAVIKTVLETLPLLLDNPKDTALRGTLLWCSTLALNGIQGAGRNPSQFVLHSIEHSLSGVRHQLAHGRGLATLYVPYFRWLVANGRGEARLARLGATVFDIAPGKLADNKAGALAFIEQFDVWLAENGLQQNLLALGFSADIYPAVAQYALDTYGNGSELDALGPMTKNDIVELLTAS